jgi:hypothetical protein
MERQGKKRRWTIRYVKPGEDAKQAPALADLWCKDNDLLFQWTAEAAKTPAAEQLRNGVVKFSVADKHHLLPLRKAVIQPIYSLDLSKRTTYVTYKLTNPPKAVALNIEIRGAERMPVAAGYQSEKRISLIPQGPLLSTLVAPTKGGKSPRPPIRKPPGKTPAVPQEPPLADEDPSRIVILFDKFSTGQHPQLWIDPRQDGAGAIEVAVSALLVGEKERTDLTAKAVEDFRTPRNDKLKELERDYGSLRDRGTFLDKRIGEIKANAKLTGAALVKARSEVKKMQQELTIVQRDTKKLEDQIKVIKDELQSVTFADNLIRFINRQAQFQYRVYAKSGDAEVDLVRGGWE